MRRCLLLLSVVVSVALAQPPMETRREATLFALSRMGYIVYDEASQGLANPDLLPLPTGGTEEDTPLNFGRRVPAADLHALQHIMDASVFIDGVASGRRNSAVWHAGTQTPNPVADRILDEWTRAAIQTINARQFHEARTLIGQALHMVQDRSNHSEGAVLTFLTGIRNATIDLFPQVLGIRRQSQGKDLVVVVDTTYQAAAGERLRMLLSRVGILNQTLSNNLAGFTLYTFDRVNAVPKSHPYQTTADGFTVMLGNLIAACSAQREICTDTDTNQTDSRRHALEAVSLAARNADSRSTIILLTDAAPVVTSTYAPRVVSAILESKQQRLVIIGVNNVTKQADYARIVERTGGSFTDQSANPLTGSTEAAEQVFHFAVRDDLALAAVVDASRDVEKEIVVPLYGTEQPAGIWIGSVGVMICEKTEDGEPCVRYEAGTWVTVGPTNQTEWRIKVKHMLIHPDPTETWSVRAYISTESFAQLGLYRLDPFSRHGAEGQRVENDPLVGVDYTVMTLGSTNATISLVTATTEVVLTGSSGFNEIQAQANLTVPAEPFRIRVTETVNGTAYHRFTDIIRPTRSNATITFSRPVEVQVPGGNTVVRMQFAGNTTGRVSAVDHIGFVSRPDTDILTLALPYDGGITLLSNITVPLGANHSVNYMVFGMGSDRLYQDALPGNYLVRPMVLIPGVAPTPPQCTANATSYNNCPKGPQCANATWDTVLEFTDAYGGFLDTSTDLRTEQQSSPFNPATGTSTNTYSMENVNGTAVFRVQLDNYSCCRAFRFYLAEDSEARGACEFGWVHATTTPPEGMNTTAIGATVAPADDGLSGGEIAGIVIGVLAGVALLAGIAFFVMKRRRS